MSKGTRKIITDTGLVVEGDEDIVSTCNHQIIVLQCPSCGEEVEKTIKCPFCGELMRVVSVLNGDTVPRVADTAIIDTKEEEEEFGPIIPEEDEEVPQGLIDLGE